MVLLKGFLGIKRIYLIYSKKRNVQIHLIFNYWLIGLCFLYFFRNEKDKGGMIIMPQLEHLLFCYFTSVTLPWPLMVLSLLSLKE